MTNNTLKSLAVIVGFSLKIVLALIDIAAGMALFIVFLAACYAMILALVGHPPAFLGWPVVQAASFLGGALSLVLVWCVRITKRDLKRKGRDMLGWAADPANRTAVGPLGVIHRR